MKCIFQFCLLLMAILPACAQGGGNSIDSLLKTYYSDVAPGAVVLISRNDTVIFNKAYGLANITTGKKISNSTNFNIGSLTKQFTAYCILKLAENKQLNLNDKLIKYFPDFNSTTGNLVTLQQLLTHSSGITDHYGLTDTSIIKHAVDKDVLQAIQKTGTTYFTPGTQYRYSNTAYCLLALVIEKVSGLSYPAYIQKNIFTPLGMKHATVLHIGTHPYQQAIGYDYNENKQQFSKLDAEEAIFFSTQGDGGIYLSAGDYLHWWHFIQHPPAPARNIIRKLRTAQSPVDRLNKLSYGYGWFVSEKDTAKAVYHTGSNGGFRSIVFSIPAQHYMVAVFSNRTGIDLEMLVQQINTLQRVTNNSFTKIEGLVSFKNSSPIFAPCKEIR